MKSILERAYEKGLVKMEDDCYVVKVSGEFVNLGRKTEAMQKIKAYAPTDLESVDKVQEDSAGGDIPSDNKEASAEQSGTDSQQTNQNVPTAPEIGEVEGVDYEIVDGIKVPIYSTDFKVKAVKDYIGASDVDIYINGVNASDYNHPLVRTCPVFPIWMSKKDLLDSGTADKFGKVLMVRDYTVAREKQWGKFIRPLRNDSPGLGYYTIGDSIMVLDDRQNWFRRRAELEEKSSSVPRKVLEQRQENADRMATIKDMNVLSRTLQNANATEIAKVRENQELLRKYDPSVTVSMRTIPDF